MRTPCLGRTFMRSAFFSSVTGLCGSGSTFVESGRLSSIDFDEESFALSQCGSFAIENAGLRPVFAAVAAHDFSFHPDRGARRNRAAVVDLHMARHGSEAPGANRFAHRLIEKRGDDATMHVSGRPLKALRDASAADNVMILAGGEFQPEARFVIFSAAEAVVKASVGQRFGFPG